MSLDPHRRRQARAPGSPRRPRALLLAAVALVAAAVAGPALPSGAAEPAVPAAPAITATPSTDLVQGDTITVAGTGFPAGAFIGIIQCIPGDGVEFCSMSTLTYANADGSGAFSIPFTPRRTLNIGGVIHDCADLGACRIGAGTVPDGAGGSATVDIRFDPSVPPPPPPAITVTPDTGLLDGDSVIVEGQDFAPNGYVNILQCATPLDALSNDCRFTGAAVQASAAGTFTISVTVARLVISLGTAVDCADPGACVLFASPGSLEDSATAPITFDGSVPLPPPPTMTVTPSVDLLDGDVVQVTGAGFTPNSPVAVIQCQEATSPDGTGCNLAGYRTLQADGAGALSTDFTVDRILYTGGTSVDCALETCRLVLAGLPYGYPNVSTDLAFDASVPPPPPPTLVADPSTGLVDGQTVTVHGSGYPRNRTLGMAQCLTGDQSPSGCDLQHYRFVQTDDDGSFTSTFTVYATYQSDQGTIDCVAVPGRCRIGAGTAPGEIGADAVLTFSTSAPTTPTTATTAPGPEVEAANATAVRPNFTG